MKCEFHHLLKLEPTQCSETSAFNTQTPGKYPEDNLSPVILPVVLCGGEARSLTLREEIKLRVFESRVLKRTFDSDRGELTGEWRRLHNEELYELY
jgi:hypothetical protein